MMMTGQHRRGGAEAPGGQDGAGAAQAEVQVNK